MTPAAVRRLEAAREKRSRLHARVNAGRLGGARPADVKNVLVVASASRSGSSFLYYLLSGHPDVVSLNGEGNVFERLHGVGIAASEKDSDHVPAGSVPDDTLARVAEDMLRDSGALWRSEAREPFPRENFLADSAQRLLLQYAEADLDPAQVYDACAAAFDGAAVPRFSAIDYWRGLLAALAAKSLPVRAEHYDLRGGDAGAGGAAPPPFETHSLEDPPFIVPQPRTFPPREALGGKTLLLKSSSDAYRMWLVKRMFPSARFRFVVLTRNPAAAVSSLMDGWLSGGFYSQNLGAARLDIGCYSRDDRPWTRRWWKFDLPPGWAERRARPLQDVCALQWRSANEHIRAAVAPGAERLDVRYETFLDAAAADQELARILEFAGLARSHAGDRRALPPIMAVTPPAPGKWRKRRDVLAPLVAEDGVAALASAMGYDVGRWQDWP
jgi:hypothetical protein